MKPNARMLAKAASPPLDDGSTRSKEGRAERLALARASFAERDAIARARLAPGAILDRVAMVAKALEGLVDPPALGVKANGTENTPTKTAWDSARKVALERIKALHATLKRTLEDGIPVPVPVPVPVPAPQPAPHPQPVPPPVPAPPMPHPVPHPPSPHPAPVPAPPAPMPGPQVRGAESKIDEDELNHELARLKQSLDKHKPEKPEK